MSISADEELARGMGSPRHGSDRRWRTREGPELEYVQTPIRRGGTRGSEG